MSTPAPAESEPPTSSVPVAALKALRPKQWTKNVLLFAALLFSLEFTKVDQILMALWGFGAFCLVSSVGYVVNDIRDREADAKHPKKRLRPIASGALPVRAAWTLVAVLFVAGFATAFGLSAYRTQLTGEAVPWFGLLAAAYFLNTNIYTFWGKNQVIVDIMMISFGFILRAVAGAVAIGVPISPWLLLCAGFFALFLGFNKRRGELAVLEDGKASEHRKNLAEYSMSMLDEFQSITTSGTIISYALYTVLGSPTPWLLLTMPLPLYGIFRYIYLVQARGEGGDPSQILLQDKPILLVCLLYGAVAAAILLFAPLRAATAF